MEILEVIQFLLEHGADPNVRAYIGLTLLLIATQEGKYEIAARTWRRSQCKKH